MKTCISETNSQGLITYTCSDGTRVTSYPMFYVVEYKDGTPDKLLTPDEGATLVQEYLHLTHVDRVEHSDGSVEFVTYHINEVIPKGRKE